MRFHAKLFHGHRACAKGIGLDDVSTGGQELPVNLYQRLWVGQGQHVHEIFQVLLVIRKPITPHLFFGNPHTEDRGPHGTIENEYSFV